MQSLMELLPEAPVCLGEHVDQAIPARLEQIADFFGTRQEAYQISLSQAKAKAKNPDNIDRGTSVYKPLPPQLLYLSESELDKFIKKPMRSVRIFNSQSMPPETKNAFSCPVDIVPDKIVDRNKGHDALFQAISNQCQTAQQGGKIAMIACHSTGTRDRLMRLAGEHGVLGQKISTWDDVEALDKHEVAFSVLPMAKSFESPETLVLTETSLLGTEFIRRSAPAAKKRRAEDALAHFSDLNVGDYVVHIEHGVGQFVGLENLSVEGIRHDFLKLIYAGDDKLYVPVEHIDVLSRYGSDHAHVQLDKLGGAGWQRRKAKVKKDLFAMAQKMIDLAAERSVIKAPQIHFDEALYDEFCARFPYEPTEDQKTAIASTLSGLQQSQPMDRLVCGDVGFGKTEVALRAAFAVASTGHQVALIVPTTLLARQHAANFQQRFKDFAISIGQLSRFVTPSEATKVKQKLENGQMDIVIGTHALLSDKIKFKSLGILIVDEEQRFGVKQKEKLKNLSQNTHVLTLTATPIPRTLQLAMSGIRQMSLIATPPIDRLAVRSFILPHDPVIIREAIMREYYRGGQCFYVCPRIKDLKKIEEFIQSSMPEIKFVTAHGQMPSQELDERMTDFYEGRYQVLIATNIIESGLDIPNANTIIVHRADLFGLAQLYQIRGRVGRGKTRAYAYLTYHNQKSLSETAKQRLHVMGTLDSLGAGFQLASHDMDIRGAGNILGEEQSGHIQEVGVALYQDMLAEAVTQVKSDATNQDENPPTSWTPQLNLGIDVMIPESYVPDLPTRLSLYRRVSGLKNYEEREAFAAELIDRFGELPNSVENLLLTVHLKQLCLQAKIEKFEAGSRGAVIHFNHDHFSNVTGLMTFIQASRGKAKIRPDQSLFVGNDWSIKTTKLKESQALLEQLMALSQD